MDHILVKYYKSPLGELILGSYEDQLCLCDWRFRKMRASIDDRIQKALKASYTQQDSTVADAASTQLDEYFAGRREEFSIKLLMVGTAFQQKVWSELTNIPFGETETYHGLSKRLNNEPAIRAVAAANGANAVSIFIPCHRIIGSKGEMVGYAGGKDVKMKLLMHENALPKDDQLSLF